MRTRNPFSVRRSESIDAVPAFLNLFEPGVLEILDRDHWCENVQPIRSARGGGKTSLLRLFTPAALNNLHLRKQEDGLKDLFRRLKELGAVEDDGPKVLGVMLMCGRNYEMLEDLNLEESRRMRLFFGLLNARIILATLRAATEMRHLGYPAGVAQIEALGPIDDRPVPGLTFPCTGGDLVRWSAELESQICTTLDSFGPLRAATLPGHDELFSLSIIRPDRLTYNGQPVAERTLLMMDDIHKLTAAQRGKLVETVVELRSPIGIWIAERFEALSPEEMLAAGAAEGRDYLKPIAIEQYWRKRHKAFEKHTMTIADRRAKGADVEDFRSCLVSPLDQGRWEGVFVSASQTIRARLETKVRQVARYRDWFSSVEAKAGTPRERALDWRSLEILIARRDARAQQVLFDDALPVDQLTEQFDSNLRDAAELFLSREFDLPYYFGQERVARLASLNIQQFLGLSVGLFEDVLSATLLGQTATLPPERQHKLMKAAAKSVWDEIPRSVRHGRAVQNLLKGIGQYARAYTYRPTAPNDPGVGGTAIRMSEREQLRDPAERAKRPDYQRLMEVLASALAHNLLVADLDYSCKNEKWMVLNLNRLLCVHYDLPLGYGLYKEQPLRTIGEWLDKPYHATQPELF